MHVEPIPVSRPWVFDAARDALDRCFESAWWGYGPICQAVEDRFTAAHGGWALAASSCTAALYIVGKLLWRPYAEVVVPAMTYASTALAFLEAGFRVRVADVTPETLMLDEASLEHHLTPKTVAVVVVHLFGQRYHTRTLRRLCDRRGIALVEDCAHRLDIMDPNSHDGDFACYSFNAVKEAPAGEGGVLWGRSPALYDQARSAANVGLSSTTWTRTRGGAHTAYRFDARSGMKLLLNDLAASLADAALERLPALRDQRRRIYARMLDACRFAAIPATPMPFGDDHSALMCVVRVPASLRESVRGVLAAHGVHTAIHYPSLADHPLLSGNPQSCPIASEAARQVLTLPCFLGMTDDDVARVAAATAAAAASAVPSHVDSH